MDVFAFATRMELDGKAHYEKMAAECAHPGLKTLFGLLAADEQKHYEMLQRMAAGNEEMVASTALAAAKNVFADLKMELKVPAGLQKEIDGCQYGLQIEAESVRLYEELAGREEDPGIRRLLLRIAAEEQQHYNILENLYDFLLRPEYFLEWREFSNLKPL